MREFFKGWRRKVGCVALLATCVFFAIRMRALVDARLHPAVSIVCIWEPAARIPDDCLGVAGQIFFLDSDSLAHAVEGTVQIDVFQGQNNGLKPLHQFHFDSAAWNQHYSYSRYMGPTYNVFIPYANSDPGKPIAGLRLRLVPNSGPVVSSDTSVIELGGLAGVRYESLNAIPKPVRFDRTASLWWFILWYRSVPILLMSVLSAWLILWKPRMRIPDPAAEPLAT